MGYPPAKFVTLKSRRQGARRLLTTRYGACDVGRGDCERSEIGDDLEN